MRTTLMAAVLWACHGPDSDPQDPPDTDGHTEVAGTDTGPGSAAGIVWDLPGEAPPTELHAVWIARFRDDGDLPVGAMHYEGNGTRRSMSVFGEPPVAAITVIATDFPDACKSFLNVEAAHTAAAVQLDAGDREGAIATLEAAEPLTPEDYWMFSAGAVATELPQLDVWDLWDMSTAMRTASSTAIGGLFHHTADQDWAAALDGGDAWANLDSWVPTGPLRMTGLDPVAGTLDLAGTLQLRRCPATDKAIPYTAPCDYPNDGTQAGTVEITLTATRCPELEDEIAYFW